MAAQKQETNKKKIRISFKESKTQLSDKQKSLSYLDYLQTVQGFFCFSDRDLYVHFGIFLSVPSNLYVSKIHFKGINSNKILWLPVQ